MPQTAVKGQYYEFDRSRFGIELGRNIPPPQAVTLVRGGRDVYTLNKEDAYKLAKSVYGMPPTECFTAHPSHFSHYHPGGMHPQYGKLDPKTFGKAREGFGHVFFNLRGGR